MNILGYTLNPQPAYNFVLEKKTVTYATKSDGAILSNGGVIGVVELKDTGTPDLDKVSNQSFGYKHKHKHCIYVITSNFEKLRLYINDSTDYEEFELFTLTPERFAVLYLCLHKQNLLLNLPLQIKQASLLQEENITKKLYADYSVFKRKLFQNIAIQNPHLYSDLVPIPGTFFQYSENIERKADVMLSKNEELHINNKLQSCLP